MLKIGIVGGGVVGRATARSFMEHAEVRVYDTVPERKTHGLVDTLECDIVFVCLPTPQKAGPRELACDTSIIEKFFTQTDSPARRQVNYVIRSTVPPGFTLQLKETYRLSNVVHSPEFLTARCAITDAQLPARNIIGAPTTNKNMIYSPPAIALANLYSKRFPGVFTHFMTSTESELVKLGQNAFFAVKVAYFNELNRLCEHAGADFEQVRKGILSDGRIAHSHTTVPGPDGQYGFGGMCLPKDLASFVAACEAYPSGGLNSVSRAALERNIDDRSRGREIEQD